MAAIDIDLDTASVEEMMDAFEKAAKLVPWEFENMLISEQKKFKSMMIKETHAAVGTKTGNLTKGFRFEGPYKVGNDVFTNFLAENRKNPHWHLIQNGHEKITPKTRKGKPLKDGGKAVGWVPGYRITEPVVEAFETVQEDYMRKTLKRLMERLE